jgi:hypothetical protein
MKYNEFTRYTPVMVITAQKIIKQDGYCFNVVCQNCPAFKKNRKDDKFICDLCKIIYEEKNIKFYNIEYQDYIVKFMKQYLNLIQKRKLQLLRNEV